MQAKWAQADCQFCALGECDAVLRRTGFVIRRCPQCGLLWCDPLRLDAAFHKSNEKAYLDVSETTRREGEARLRVTARFAPPEAHPRLLEIGCMHGDFLEAARAAGYEVTGLDLSESAVAVANQRLPGVVRLGTLDGSWPAESVDIVAAFNVVEHMDAPAAFLREVRRVLAPHGLAVIETPVQESLYHHVRFCYARLFPSSRKDVGMTPGGHIFKFGRKSWRVLLRGSGFQVLHVAQRSTPIRELLRKSAAAGWSVRAGLVVFGLLARVLAMGNRVIVVARKS